MKISKVFEKMLPMLILGLATVLRFIFLGDVPEGIHQDEAFVSWNAFALLTEGMDSAGNKFPVYLSAWGDGQSLLYSLLLVPLYALVGTENITLFVTRFPQAVIGVVTVWVTYLLLKKMFGRKCGLWGMFFLAVCPWHVMMCRWALDANLAPAFLVFGLYFFVCALDDNRYLILTALFYGMSLYTYAVIWPIVPLMLILMSVYGIAFKKLSVNRWSIIATIILGLLALPLILFVVINSMENGTKIELPFMTIPMMVGFRSGELATSLGQMYANLRRVITHLGRQNVCAPYDILLPYGLFYDVGRVFIIVGFVALVKDMIKKIRKKEFSYEVLIFVQLIGAGVVGALVHTHLQHINCLYIPLVMCGAYGIWKVFKWLQGKAKRIGQIVEGGLVLIFLTYTVFFQKDYYGDYEDLVNAYYALGMKEAMEYAMEQGDEIVVEEGAMWSRVLYYSMIKPSEYLATVEYAYELEPAKFSDDENTYYIGIDVENIDPERIYILYYTYKDYFLSEFDLTQFEYWYVAVPK